MPPPEPPPTVPDAGPDPAGRGFGGPAGGDETLDGETLDGTGWEIGTPPDSLAAAALPPHAVNPADPPESWWRRPRAGSGRRPGKSPRRWPWSRASAPGSDAALRPRRDFDELPVLGAEGDGRVRRRLRVAATLWTAAFVAFAVRHLALTEEGVTALTAAGLPRYLVVIALATTAAYLWSGLPTGPWRLIACEAVTFGVPGLFFLWVHRSAVLGAEPPRAVDVGGGLPGDGGDPLGPADPELRALPAPRRRPGVRGDRGDGRRPAGGGGGAGPGGALNSGPSSTTAGCSAR